MTRRKRYIHALPVIALVISAAAPAIAADDSKVKAANRQVETGAKKIGAGKVGEGVEQTAKGIGKTVEEGAKYTGEKLKEAGKAAEPEAKSVGRSITSFFGRLFGGD